MATDHALKQLYLFQEARRLTGIGETPSPVRLGIEALIARESARRLALLGARKKD